VFSAEELARLRAFPEINRAELIRYFTLTGADEAFVRQFRTGRNVLGAAVQLRTLPWPGFVPDEVGLALDAVVGRLSQRLGIAMGELRGYGEREQTRTDHLREVAGYAGWPCWSDCATACAPATSSCPARADTPIPRRSCSPRRRGRRRRWRSATWSPYAAPSPTPAKEHHENVHFYGSHSVDIDGELAQLDTDGYRPLRRDGTAAAMS